MDRAKKLAEIGVKLKGGTLTSEEQASLLIAAINHNYLTINILKKWQKDIAIGALHLVLQNNQITAKLFHQKPRTYLQLCRNLNFTNTPAQNDLFLPLLAKELLNTKSQPLKLLILTTFYKIIDYNPGLSTAQLKNIYQAVYQLKRPTLENPLVRNRLWNIYWILCSSKNLSEPIKQELYQGGFFHHDYLVGPLKDEKQLIHILTTSYPPTPLYSKATFPQDHSMSLNFRPQSFQLHTLLKNQQLSPRLLAYLNTHYPAFLKSTTSWCSDMSDQSVNYLIENLPQTKLLNLFNSLQPTLSDKGMNVLLHFYHKCYKNWQKNHLPESQELLSHLFHKTEFQQLLKSKNLQFVNLQPQNAPFIEKIINSTYLKPQKLPSLS